MKCVSCNKKIPRSVSWTEFRTENMSKRSFRKCTHCGTNNAYTTQSSKYSKIIYYGTVILCLVTLYLFRGEYFHFFDSLDLPIGGISYMVAFLGIMQISSLPATLILKTEAIQNEFPKKESIRE